MSFKLQLNSRLKAKLGPRATAGIVIGIGAQFIGVFSQLIYPAIMAWLRRLSI